MKCFTNSKTKGYRELSNLEADNVHIIKPISGWQLINFRELKQYQDLFWFMVWRDIKVRYAQTIMGFGWAILQPLIQIILFSVIFGKVARIPTEGIPYILFSTVAIIPWTYMSQTMTKSSASLVGGSGMLGKIYFPRLIFPITPVLANLIDFGLSLIIVVVVMAYYLVLPTWNLLFFPLLVLLMMSISAGVGMLLAAMAIRYRDVQHVMGFMLRFLMYSAPVVYSASSIPETYRFYYSLNPIVGVIEGFRACLLGSPMPWIYIWPGILSTLLILVGGALYFKRMEQIFVDVI